MSVSVIILIVLAAGLNAVCKDYSPLKSFHPRRFVRGLIFAIGIAVLGIPPVQGAERNPAGKAPVAGRSERHYTMKASMRPLLFWISRDGVGGGRIAWTQEAGSTTGLELLIGSDPDRAPRRINRWGYISERVYGSSAELLGVMTQSDEQSIEQADAGTSKTANKHAFRAIRSRLNGREAQSSVTSLLLAENFTYKDFEALLAQIPKTGSTVQQLQVPPGADPGFLFAVKAMMHAGVEGYRNSGRPDRNLPAPRRYVYNATLFDLSVISSNLIGNLVVNGRTYRGVIESEFEARNTRTGKISHFMISFGTDNPILEIPVRIVYQPRWWFQAELLLDDETQVTQVTGRTVEK